MKEKMTLDYFNEYTRLCDSSITSIYRLMRKERAILKVKTSFDCSEVKATHEERREKLEHVASILCELELDFIKNADVI